MSAFTDCGPENLIFPSTPPGSLSGSPVVSKRIQVIDLEDDTRNEGEKKKKDSSLNFLFSFSHHQGRTRF